MHFRFHESDITAFGKETEKFKCLGGVVVIYSKTNHLSWPHGVLTIRQNFGSVENAGCGVRSAECGECGVWRMRCVENAECGKNK